MEKFNVDKKFIDENADEIVSELWTREEVLDVVYFDCFDIIFELYIALI